MFIQSILPSISNDSFQAAATAMSELTTAGCIGSGCVKLGFLDSTIVSSLAKSCFSIFLPMFLCTSIMNTIDRFGLDKKSLMMPAIAVIHSFLLFQIGKSVLFPIFDIDPESVEGRATNVCCAFGNSSVLPLIFVDAIFRNSSKDVYQKAVSQISLYVLGWSPFFWKFGQAILLGRQKAEFQTEKSEITFSTVFSALKSLLPLPVLGITLGIIIASIPQLKNLFMVSNTNQNPPLKVILNSFQNFGKAYNPVALIVLTASLALSGSTNKSQSNTVDIDTQSLNEKDIPLLNRWLCVSITRFIISPMIMILILQTCHRKGMFGAIDDPKDAMIWFVNMLEAVMPPAQNSVLMLQVGEKPHEASRLARFLFTMYCSAMIPLVFFLTILLEKCSLI